MPQKGQNGFSAPLKVGAVCPQRHEALEQNLSQNGYGFVWCVLCVVCCVFSRPFTEARALSESPSGAVFSSEAPRPQLKSKLQPQGWPQGSRSGRQNQSTTSQRQKTMAPLRPTIELEAEAEQQKPEQSNVQRKLERLCTIAMKRRRVARRQGLGANVDAVATIKRGKC